MPCKQVTVLLFMLMIVRNAGEKEG